MRNHKVTSITKALYALTHNALLLITKIRLLIPILFALFCICKGSSCLGSEVANPRTFMLSDSACWSGPAWFEGPLDAMVEDHAETIYLITVEVQLPFAIQDDHNLAFQLDPSWSCDPTPVSYQYAIQTCGSTLVLEVHFGPDGVTCGDGRFGTISGLCPAGSASSESAVEVEGGLVVIESVDAF